MRALCAGVIVAIVVLTAPSTVGAAEEVDVQVAEVGWWSANPAAFPQSEGGFQVSADPSGAPQSLAALRVVIPASSVETLEVRLDEAGSVGTEFGAIKLCLTSDAWTAANPGALEDAPTPDCTRAAGLTRTVDGVWLGDAAELAPNGGEVSVMVVPNYQPPAPLGPPMVVSISGGDLTATGSSTPVSVVDDGADAGFSGSDDSVDLFGPPAGTSFGVPAFDAEPDFGVVTPEPPPDTGGAVVPDSIDGDDGFALTPLDSESEPSAPWIRLVVLLPLSVGFGLGSVRLRRALAEGLLGRA